MSETWKTAITEIKPNEVRLRGYRLDELMGNISFGQAIYLALKGELPTENLGKMIDAILVSSIDHGVTPPSALAAMTIASTGAPLNAAVAGGILAISKYHGGAIRDCMGVLLQVQDKIKARQLSVNKAAEEVVSEYKEIGRRISGFGHRYHTEDPRAARLFALAEELKVGDHYIKIARAIESELRAQTGNRLPINVDGAIAAVLCELDFPPKLGNAFFMMARLPGLVAHAFEEQTREKPMRKITPDNYEYDGPEHRSM
ncbi:MAG: citryl-CoA lyase [Calditrichaeota bacterium]|nr:MAG: citryl-CoA lyase [Calditrichota bacterium]